MKNPSEKAKEDYLLVASKKTVIQPFQQDTIECFVQNQNTEIADATGIVTPNEKFEQKHDLLAMSSINHLDKTLIVKVSVFNPNDRAVTICKDTEIAKFKLITPRQAQFLQPLDLRLILLAKMRNSENFEQELNQLLQVSTVNGESQPDRPLPKYNKLWFPTPETWDPSEKLTPVQRKIYNQLQESREAEQRKPLENENGKIWFLQQFQWENSVLNEEQRNEVEKLLLEFNDIFARHHFDVGYNTEYKVKLNPDERKRVYTQSHPSAIHLREELLVELALFQYYNISNSRYSSPIFAQRKSNGRLRLLIDLRRVNHLLRQEYRDSNFPISNMSDATNHCAGKSLLNKFDCSQAYHCVQMADDQSIQLLAFNCSSRTYAYKCLAQRLAKSVRGFSAFIRNYLDP